MSHFRRAQSKVWFGNEPENAYQSVYQSIYSSIDREMSKTYKAPPYSINSSITSSTGNTSWSSRQGSPQSHKSQVKNFKINQHFSDRNSSVQLFNFLTGFRLLRCRTFTS